MIEVRIKLKTRYDEVDKNRRLYRKSTIENAVQPLKEFMDKGSIYVYSPETKVDFRNCAVPLTYAIGIMRGINIEEGYADIELYDEKPDIENYSLGMTYLGVPINLGDEITEIIEMKIICFQLIKD